jgi:FKBP-type peptidyl-prolyl cis-trans isomerase SlyD
MKVDVNTVVTLNYTLTNEATGEQIEKTDPNHPMQFLFGIERVIPKFEEAIQGLEAGEQFAVSISAEEAYGKRMEDQVAVIPINVFHDETGKVNDEHIFVDALVPMTDSEGNHLRGRVMEITDEHVHMDFNHPLAEMDLRFEGEIAAVREATQDELSHGHTHGEHGHHH